MQEDTQFETKLLGIMPIEAERACPSLSVRVLRERSLKAVSQTALDVQLNPSENRNMCVCVCVWTLCIDFNVVQGGVLWNKFWSRLYHEYMRMRDIKANDISSDIFECF